MTRPPGPAHRAEAIRRPGRLTRRGLVVGLAVLAATLAVGPSAQAQVAIDPGPLFGTPAGPVVSPPNVFPLPPPRLPDAGLAPAPADEDRSLVARDAEADDPSGDTEEPGATEAPETPEPRPDVPEPAGKLSRVDDKFLKRNGIDPHEVKDENDLRPPSFFDIYVDQQGNMFGVRKGTDPKFGQFLGNLEDG